MTWMQWFAVFLAGNIFHWLMYNRFYKRAGYPSWYAIIPVYNLYILTKIINRPWWWMLLLFIPVVNLLMIPTYWFQVLEVFGKNTPKDKILTLLTLGLYIVYLNWTQADKLPYRPQHDDKETVLGVIVFAVVAATLVHTFGFQPFVIPTSSLENTLLVGDYLFVSKLHYGPRLPMTTIQVPMLHDTVPVIKVRSYLKRPQLPYMRLPGFQKLKRNDLVVFNWPADTVHQFFKAEKGVRKPIDKKSHYVKRCVGLPGDTLEVRAGILYINGHPASYPDRTELKHDYIIKTKKGLHFSRRQLRRLFDKYHVYEWNAIKDGYWANLTAKAAEALKTFPETDTVYMALDTTKGRMFGHPEKWSMDYFGPIYIPRKGDKVVLTRENYPLYKKLLEEYETGQPLTYNKVEWRNGSVYINGKPVKEYTFKQNYYWMMGDNRSHSEDSRFWGFVPWTHIVGKPVFIWFSKDNVTGNIRWDRVFTTVSGKGKRVSYLWPFVIFALLAWVVWPYYKKRKKNAR